MRRGLFLNPVGRALRQPRARIAYMPDVVRASNAVRMYGDQVGATRAPERFYQQSTNSTQWNRSTNSTSVPFSRQFPKQKIPSPNQLEALKLFANYEVRASIIERAHFLVVSLLVLAVGIVLLFGGGALVSIKLIASTGTLSSSTPSIRMDQPGKAKISRIEICYLAIGSVVLIEGIVYLYITVISPHTTPLCNVGRAIIAPFVLTNEIILCLAAGIMIWIGADSCTNLYFKHHDQF